jgi:C-8 sterol isomerase
VISICSAQQEIAVKAIQDHPNGSPKEIVDNVVQQMQAAYPGYVMENPKWMFNNAGGAMGSMLVLHCSFSEYVIIFGTAVGTEGHTGRFMADDYFTILYGEQVDYACSHVFDAGSASHSSTSQPRTRFSMASLASTAFLEFRFS